MRDTLKQYSTEMLVDELKGRGKVLTSELCPCCELEFDVAPELVLLEVGDERNS